MASEKVLKYVAGMALLLYLLGLGFFAFRPFQFIPGRLHESGSAMEARYHNVVALRKALVKSGRLTLGVWLQTDSSGQGGPARIITYSRDPMSRNFTLGQSGDALVFRLRTTETEFNGQYRSLLVPGVFSDQRVQHLAVTFDGSEVRLYIDGQLHPASLELGGDFSGWGRNHQLVFGDEPAGGRPWHGNIHHVVIYDRVLDAGEIVSLWKGTSVSDPVFQNGRNMQPLCYRNLFVTTDAPAYRWDDCIANILGFIPLAPLLWLAFPGHLKKIKCTRLLLLSVLLGLVLSGIFEFAQRSIAGRVPTLLDLVYNAFGAWGGGLMTCLMSRRRKGESA